MEAHDKEEAENFFLRNHSDSLTCVKEGVTKEIDSYPEACAFFG